MGRRRICRRQRSARPDERRVGQPLSDTGHVSAPDLSARSHGRCGTSAYDSPQPGDSTMKIVGVIPARMAASRFPGKPLFPIHGRPMLEHVYLRARMYSSWDRLVVATCDDEIWQFATAKGFPVVM